jgi:hypothetical protein
MQTGRIIKRFKNILIFKTIYFANNNMTLIIDKGIFNIDDGSSFNTDGIKSYKV